jgi:hypothetical protein
MFLSSKVVYSLLSHQLVFVNLSSISKLTYVNLKLSFAISSLTMLKHMDDNEISPSKTLLI